MTKEKAKSKRTSRKKAAASASTTKDNEMESGEITTKKALNRFLNELRDKMSEGSCSPVYSLTSINYVLNLSNIYDLLNDENKEIARDIWLRLKAAGFDLNPPLMLFKKGEINTTLAL